MLDRMMNQEDNPRNPRNEPERRKEERRREDRRPEEEKRREQRRENVQMMDSRPMRQNEAGMTPDSLPRSDKDSRTKNPESWEGENFQSGTSQAQKAQGSTPEQQTVPAERHEQKGEGVAGLSTSGPGQSFGPGGRAHSFGGDGSQKDRQKNDEGEKRHATDFGESHDRPFGRGDAGGKIDSTQRDFGQTGQNMKAGGQVHSQQGPYGPPEKHRGPQAPGKPLMDDWGKSDKH